MAERFTQLFGRVGSRPRRQAEAILGRPITKLVDVTRYRALSTGVAILAVILSLTAGDISVWTFVAVVTALVPGHPGLSLGVLVEADDGSLWLIRGWPNRRAEPAHIRRPNRRWYFDTAVVINEQRWSWYKPADLKSHLETDLPDRATASFGSSPARDEGLGLSSSPLRHRGDSSIWQKSQRRKAGRFGTPDSPK